VIALARIESGRLTPRRRHAPRAEYFAWVGRVLPNPAGASMRRWFYNRFVTRWPDLDAWFAEPLLVRLDLHGRSVREIGKRIGPSHEAGSYLAYLSLVHGIAMDAAWVLSRNFDSLFYPRIAAGLGLDLALIDALVERMLQLGYGPVTGRASLSWALARLVLWRGDPDLRAITYDDLIRFGEEVRLYCARPEAGFIRASHVKKARRITPLDELAQQFQKEALGRLHRLHVLLFNDGRVTQVPLPNLRSCPLWKNELVPPSTPRAIATPIERWLRLRLQTTDRAESVRNCRDSFRYFLRWLSEAHPEITSLVQLKRIHLEGFLTHLHLHINPRNGLPLSGRTRHTYIGPLLSFFRETSQWGWDDVPGRPLLGRADLPKLPLRLPRFIPRADLVRLMVAVETLDNPHQRTALLLLRWSGARRGEIARLSLDCLDAYPDGHPRLRIPAGKTYTERMVPLHPQAADPLRELIALATLSNAAARHDPSAGKPVRFVFMLRGKPMGRHYLFEEPLAIACRQAGLVDRQGRPTVTAHRFRHTVGTQLAEGGARIQTIMAILGHRSAQMSATYSRVSDPVVKEQYEQIIAAGGRIAGPAAEALIANRLDDATVDWLKTNFLKTELELGHCLRLPQEGPCECDLYLRCSKFFTTSEYAPRLRARLACEQQLIDDAVERGWPREVERHTATSRRLCELLADLGEPTDPAPPAPPTEWAPAPKTSR
jgi:integrase